MHALHLIGMRGAGGRKLRFYPTEQAPLVLPSWLPAGDREILLAFYQQILGDDLLPRVEVDWYKSLVLADRRFLRKVRERPDAGAYLVVVKVRGEGVAFEEVALQPELQQFEHLAIAGDYPVEGETYGRLQELTHFVRSTVEELYDEMVDELALRPDGNALLEPIVRTLLNPIHVVETHNALLDVQSEATPPELHARAVHRLILPRLLSALPHSVAVALIAITLRGLEGMAEAMGEAQRAEALAALRARMLIRDGRLVRWAHWLEEPALRNDLLDVAAEELRRIARPARGRTLEAERVLGWLESSRGRRSSAPDPIREQLAKALALLDAGQLGRARDELSALERDVDSPGVADKTRADFWSTVARVRALEQREGSGERVDVLIVTATPLERDAVLAVERGATAGSTWKRLRTMGLWLAVRDFAAEGGTIRIAVTMAPGMGNTNALITSAQLVQEYDPRCLSMCGLCAGRRGEVELGDVIIADRMWTYDAGKLRIDVVQGRRTVQEYEDIEMYQMHPPEWLLAAEQFTVDPRADWLDLRPNAASKPFRIHVGPMASGNLVVEDPEIFTRLSRSVRQVAGVDMEASAIAALAHAHALPYSIVVKGVADHADENKDDTFQTFAARAAAEVLIAFLRRHLPPQRARHSEPLHRSSEANIRIQTGHPMHIVLVADDSGSMAGPPAQKATEAIRTWILELQQVTRGQKEYFKFSLIAFGSSSEVIAVGVNVNEIDADTVVVNGNSGSTNMAAALADARDAVIQTAAPHHCPPFVFLYTDGHPDDATAALEAAEALKATNLPCGCPRLVSFGIGSVNDQLLRQMATSPEFYKHVDDPQALIRLLPAIGTPTQRAGVCTVNDFERHIAEMNI